MDCRNSLSVYSHYQFKRTGNGEVLEATSVKVGFRTVEMKNHQLCVNGKPILVKGVNVHEHNEYTGHYVTEELMLKDFELWKNTM